jgi:hypothetical protein
MIAAPGPLRESNVLSGGVFAAGRFWQCGVDDDFRVVKSISPRVRLLDGNRLAQ